MNAGYLIRCTEKMEQCIRCRDIWGGVKWSMKFDRERTRLINRACILGKIQGKITVPLHVIERLQKSHRLIRNPD
jgi:hypothetical protein